MKYLLATVLIAIIGLAAFKFFETKPVTPTLGSITPTVDHAYSVSDYLISAFSGSAVVRLSENAGATEQDFKLNGSNVLVTNDVNEFTVATWLSNHSATVAYVADLYDQKGSLTLSNNTQANMPILNESLINSKAGFSGNQDRWLFSASNYDMETGSGTTIIGVFRFTTAPSNSAKNGIVTNNATSLEGLFTSENTGGTDGPFFAQDNAVDANGSAVTTPANQVITGIAESANGYIRQNGTQTGTVAGAPDGRARPLVLMAGTTLGASSVAMGVGEFVIVANRLSDSDISSIECNMGSLYSITVSGCSTPAATVKVPQVPPLF